MININLFIKKQSTTKKVQSLLEESLISLCLNLVLPAVNFFFFLFQNVQGDTSIFPSEITQPLVIGTQIRLVTMCFTYSQKHTIYSWTWPERNFLYLCPQRLIHLLKTKETATDLISFLRKMLNKR